MQGESETQDSRVAPAPIDAQPRQSPKDQASGNAGERPAPVAIHPIAERAKLGDRQQSAQQRPFCRYPTTQHPVAEGAEQRSSEEHAGPWESKEGAPDG